MSTQVANPGERIVRGTPRRSRTCSEQSHDHGHDDSGTHGARAYERRVKVP